MCVSPQILSIEFKFSGTNSLWLVYCLLVKTSHSVMPAIWTHSLPSRKIIYNAYNPFITAITLQWPLQWLLAIQRHIIANTARMNNMIKIPIWHKEHTDDHIDLEESFSVIFNELWSLVVQLKDLSLKWLLANCKLKQTVSVDWFLVM